MTLIALSSQSLGCYAAGISLPWNHAGQMILCKFNGCPFFFCSPGNLNGRHIPETFECISVPAVQFTIAGLQRFSQYISHLHQNLPVRLPGRFFPVFHIKQRIFTDCPHFSRLQFLFKILINRSSLQMKCRRFPALPRAADGHNG